jgi:predicted secreted hydrolase
MRSKIAALILTLTAQSWQFPRDHFNHPDFRTEWWYYTGNLQSADGHRFGFELTFFRQANDQAAAAAPSPWRPDQLYLAHLALSDIDNRRFYHTERLNRAGPGLAGADLAHRAYWNGNWRVRWVSLETAAQQLEAVTDQITLILDLKPEKPLVLHRKNSPYLSFTRLIAQGRLILNNQTFTLQGLAWMDHEFFTTRLSNDLAGWDWFSIQLANKEELMLYRMRTKNGETSPGSSGTYIDSSGASHFLASTQFSVSPSQLWQSPTSHAHYPLAWEIDVPSIALHLSEKPAFENQEFFMPNSMSPTYWEGAVTYRGQIRSRPVEGSGYLELTGYAPDSRPLSQVAPTPRNKPRQSPTHSAALPVATQTRSRAALP